MQQLKFNLSRSGRKKIHVFFISVKFSKYYAQTAQIHCYCFVVLLITTSGSASHVIQSRPRGVIVSIIICLENSLIFCRYIYRINRVGICLTNTPQTAFPNLAPQNSRSYSPSPFLKFNSTKHKLLHKLVFSNKIQN